MNEIAQHYRLNSETGMKSSQHSVNFKFLELPYEGLTIRLTNIYPQKTSF